MTNTGTSDTPPPKGYSSWKEFKEEGDRLAQSFVDALNQVGREEIAEDEGKLLRMPRPAPPKPNEQPK
jgi:hypothetical protein